MALRSMEQRLKRLESQVLLPEPLTIEFWVVDLDMTAELFKVREGGSGSTLMVEPGTRTGVSVATANGWEIMENAR